MNAGLQFMLMSRAVRRSAAGQSSDDGGGGGGGGGHGSPVRSRPMQVSHHRRRLSSEEEDDSPVPKKRKKKKAPAKPKAPAKAPAKPKASTKAPAKRKKKKIVYSEMSTDDDWSEDENDRRRSIQDNDTSQDFVPSGAEDDTDTESVCSIGTVQPAEDDAAALLADLPEKERKAVLKAGRARKLVNNRPVWRSTRKRKPVERLEDTEYFRDRLFKGYSGTLHGKKKRAKQDCTEKDFASFRKQLRKDAKKGHVLVDVPSTDDDDSDDGDDGKAVADETDKWHVNDEEGTDADEEEEDEDDETLGGFIVDDNVCD